MTRAEIDKLGERLRSGAHEDADEILLDAYRRSFEDAYQQVVGTIRDNLNLEPSGRKQKLTTSIAAKLRREKDMRLSRMQDIAGCRVVVDDTIAQTEALESVRRLFKDSRVVDRREKPSHGYRAVHVIVRVNSKLVEVQIRTTLQQWWAELSEKLSEADATIKYGGGPERVRLALTSLSAFVQKWESFETSPNLAQVSPDDGFNKLREFLAKKAFSSEDTKEALQHGKRTLVEGLSALAQPLLTSPSIARLYRKE